MYEFAIIVLFMKKNTNKHNNIVQQTLPNNISLITETVDTAKTVSIGFWFLCGSRYEKKNESGISHFVEHMLFKGTKTRSAFDIASSFDKIGGYVNAFTEREQVCLHCVVPALHVSTALNVLCDMVENSTFCTDELERERKVIMSEIISSLDDPEETALDASIETVWPNNPISSSILSTKRDIKKITRDSILEWYTTYFVKGALTVSISGNVESKAVSQCLKNLTTKKPIMEHKTEFFQPRWNGGLHFIEADFQQEQIFALYPIEVPLSYIDYYALAIVNALIGDTMSSRLFQSLREKTGSCYSVYSFVSMYSDCAYWCAYASASKKNVGAVVSLLRNELALLLDEGFLDDEIQSAKEHIIGEEIIASEDMEQRMKFLAKNFFLGFEQSSLEQTIHHIRSISHDVIYRVLKNFLQKEKEALLVYGQRVSEKARKSLQNK